MDGDSHFYQPTYKERMLNDWLKFDQLNTWTIMKEENGDFVADTPQIA